MKHMFYLMHIVTQCTCYIMLHNVTQLHDSSLIILAGYVQVQYMFKLL